MNDSPSYPVVDAAAEERPDRLDTLVPPDASDALLEAFKEGIDRTQIRKNLELTTAERAQKYLSFVRLANELREAGRRARELDPTWGLK